MRKTVSAFGLLLVCAFCPSMSLLRWLKKVGASTKILLLQFRVRIVNVHKIVIFHTLSFFYFSFSFSRKMRKRTLLSEHIEIVARNVSSCVLLQRLFPNLRRFRCFCHHLPFRGWKIWCAWKDYQEALYGKTNKKGQLLVTPFHIRPALSPKSALGPDVFFFQPRRNYICSSSSNTNSPQELWSAESWNKFSWNNVGFLCVARNRLHFVKTHFILWKTLSNKCLRVYRRDVNECAGRFYKNIAFVFKKCGKCGPSAKNVAAEARAAWEHIEISIMEIMQILKLTFFVGKKWNLANSVD